MPSTLTDIERKILDFMVQYLRDNTYQPSIREIGERFGIKSTKTVSEHLQALAEKGHLERDPSRSRGVRILNVDLQPDTVSIPCYRALPDGRGGEAAEMHLTLDRRLTGAKGGFFVRAPGEELAALGVQDGDFLLLEPVTPDQLAEGEVVAVRKLDGARGPSYRRVRKNGQGLALQAFRGGAEEVPVDEPGDLEVVGRVSALYRRMDGTTTPVSLTTH